MTNTPRSTMVGCCHVVTNPGFYSLCTPLHRQDLAYIFVLVTVFIFFPQVLGNKVKLPNTLSSKENPPC